MTNKRGSEWVRVSKVEDSESGRESYDARIWYIGEDEKEHPTKKGFRLKRPDVVDMLEKIEDSLAVENCDVIDTVAENEDRVVLAQYKAGRDELVVARIVAVGKDGVLPEEKCIDIRKWYYNEDEELMPTKFGIRMKGEVLQGVLDIIDRALRGETETAEEE